MTGLIRAADISGLPVVTIDSGEDVAEIRDVIYDGSEHKLRGFTLNKRGMFSGRLKEVLEVGGCHAIGAHAVMIDSASVLAETHDTAGSVAPKAAVAVLGNNVVSASGAHLGEVVRVIIGTDGAPSAVGYEVDPVGDGQPVFIPISEQMTISADNLLVPAEVEPFISDDLAGFGAAVTTYREGQLKGSAQ